jgi:hypothetical protein
MWKGHSDACFKLPVSPSTRDFAVQSDPICFEPPTSPLTCDFAVQSDPICLSPITSSLTCEVAIQSDPIHFPSTVSSSTQTPLTLPTSANSTATLPSSSPPPPPQLINESTVLPNTPAKLSWADDITTSLPSFIPSTAQCSPRP